MTTLAVMATSGNVGTSTIAVTIAEGLAKRGARALLLDLDVSGRATSLLGLKRSPDANAWLIGDVSADHEVFNEHPSGLRVLRNGHDDYEVINELISLPQSILRVMTRRLQEAAAERWVVIDSPKHTDVVDAIIMAADILIFPFRSEPPCEYLSPIIDRAKQLNPLAKRIVLPSRHETGKPLAQQFLNEVMRRHSLDAIVADAIPERTEVQRAQLAKKTIWEDRPDKSNDVRFAYINLMVQVLLDVVKP